jgi:nickel/cobalt transporter (NicO) family protein
MNHFQDLVQQGSLHAWFFIPAAILLGALHGLEPGHSKTMMAAFIIAIRGTVPQAALLGLSAAFSHSLIVWMLALGALHYGSQMNAETSEPYFQLASAAVILGLAVWMAWRTHRDIKAEEHHAHHHHGHDDHDHEEHHHHHDHEPAPVEYQDAHQLAHAAEIEKRFGHRTVTLGQIAIFGFTGGLMPCPAAFTIVLICLQLKRFTLGIFMVLAFSVGLAFTLVAVGALAALSFRHAEKRFAGFGKIARKLPYLSSAILFLMALYIGGQGWWSLASVHS